MDDIKGDFSISKDILETIDPLIRALVVKINMLSFVKKTHFSCAGHEKEKNNSPYIVIEYYQNDEFAEIINLFHTELLLNPNIIEFRQNEYFKSWFKLLKSEKLKKVAYHFFLFETKPIESFPEFTQKTIEDIYGYRPKQVPWPHTLDQRNTLFAWKHFNQVVDKYLIKYSK